MHILKPIVPPKYDVGFVAYNCDLNMLKELEPWCSVIYLDSGSIGKYAGQYQKEEQLNTQFNLDERIKMYGNSKPADLNHDIVIEFDCQKLTPQNFQILIELPSILKESGEVGTMELEIFTLDIKSLKEYQKDLILVK